MTTQENVSSEKTKNSEVKPDTSNEVDWEAEAKRLAEEKKKVEEEKENYRKGMLKAKGYLPNDAQNDEGDNAPSIKEVIKEVLIETELEKQSRSLEEKQRKFNEDIIRENKTLKEKLVSLNNKSQVGSASPSGSGSETNEQKTRKYGWTPEQEAALKKKGVDLQKAWENFQKERNGNIIG